jgi:sugar diacid utilization regulator/GAF domain-containing protein
MGSEQLGGLSINRTVVAGTPDSSTEQDQSLRVWLESLGEIGRAVNGDIPLRDVLDLIASTVCRLIGYDFCGVLMFRDDPPRLVVEGAAGLTADYIAHLNTEHPLSLAPGSQGSETPSGRAFSSKRSVVVNDMGSDPGLEPWSDFLRAAGFQSMLSVPLTASGRALGTVNCYTVDEHRFEQSERVQLERLADQAAIAIEAHLLRVRERETIADLQRLNADLGVQHDLLERTEALHRELMAIALLPLDLPRIVDAVSKVVGDQVVLYGPGLPTVPADAGRLDELQDRYDDDAAIFQNGEVVGHLMANIDAAGPSEAPLRRRALESGALVVSLQLQREAAAHEERLRLSSELLGQLLSAPATIDEWAVNRQAGRLGHDLREPHRVVVARLDPVPPGRAPMDALAAQRRVAAIGRSLTERLEPLPLVGYVNDSVALLIPTAAKGELGGVRELAAALQRRIRETLDPLTLSVVIGPVCRDPGDYADVCHVAMAALELRGGRSPAEGIVSLTDLGAYHFLLQVRRPGELVEFASGLLDPIRDGGRSSLLETLRVYLESKMSTTRAAEALYVHANTVTYRLRRIEEKLGMDLHDPDVLLNLRLALMVDEILAA